jgi:hypothetical protein
MVPIVVVARISPGRRFDYDLFGNNLFAVKS